MSLREYNFQVFDQESYTGFDISCTVHTAQKEVVNRVVTFLPDLSHLHETGVECTQEDMQNIMMILEQLNEEDKKLLEITQKNFGILLESSQQKYLH